MINFFCFNSYGETTFSDVGQGGWWGNGSSVPWLIFTNLLTEVMGFNKRIGRNQRKRQHPTTENAKTIRKCSVFLLGALCHHIYLQRVKTHLPILLYLRSQSRLKEKKGCRPSTNDSEPWLCIRIPWGGFRNIFHWCLHHPTSPLPSTFHPSPPGPDSVGLG